MARETEEQKKKKKKKNGQSDAKSGASSFAGNYLANSSTGGGAAGGEAIGSSADGGYLYSNPYLSSSGPTPFYVPILTAYGTYLAAQEGAAVAKGQGKDWGDTTPQEKYARGQLAWSTMGFSEIARAMQGKWRHDSTKATQAKRWQGLIDQGYTKEQLTPFYTAAHGESEIPVVLTPEQETAQENIGHGDSSGYSPLDMWGHYGVMESAGPDYLNKWTEKQRYDYTQGLQAAGILDSRKGDIIVTDHEQAELIKQSIIDGTYKSPEGQEYNPDAVKQYAIDHGAGPSEPQSISFSFGGGGGGGQSQDEANSKALALNLANNAITQGTERVRAKGISPWSENMSKYLYGNPGYGY